MNKREIILNELSKLSADQIDGCLEQITDLASNRSYQASNTGTLGELIDYWNDHDVDVVMDAHTTMIKEQTMPNKDKLAEVGEMLLLEMARANMLYMRDAMPAEIDEQPQQWQRDAAHADNLNKEMKEKAA